MLCEDALDLDTEGIDCPAVTSVSEQLSAAIMRQGRGGGFRGKGDSRSTQYSGESLAIYCGHRGNDIRQP